MKNFLINMAIVKVNWDQSKKDILSNYLPLIFYAISEYEKETLAIEDFRQNFSRLTGFDMPSSVISVLLKRASQEKNGGCLVRQRDGTYKVIRERINSDEYSNVKRHQESKYSNLQRKFVAYCSEHHPNINMEMDEHNGQHFFSLLYDLAPTLFEHVADIEQFQAKDLRENKRKYLVGKFVQYAEISDTDAFETIYAFVQGAILTEVLCYFDAVSAKGNMSSVKVFLDTQFVLRLLGYCDTEYNIPCQQMVDILRKNYIQIRIFDHTYNEICRIFNSVLFYFKQHQKFDITRPDNVSDFFQKQNATETDIQLEINSIEKSLKTLGISIEEKPKHTEKYTIDELKLAGCLSWQSRAAAHHDVDCLSAVHAIRKGMPKQSLVSCKAIFVTTNNRLAKNANNFFNQEYKLDGKVPICMLDNIFTTLLWLKTADKSSDFSKKQIVANCYAATRPNEKIWSSYIQEIKKLKERGNITEADATILCHSYEARTELMERTLDEGTIVHGTVEQVLEKAKAKLTHDKQKEISNLKKAHKSEVGRQEAKNQDFIERIKSIATKTGKCIECVIRFLLISTILTMLGACLIAINYLFPDKFPASFSDIPLNFVFAVLGTIIFTVLSFFGYSKPDVYNKVARILGRKVQDKIISFLSP